VSYGIDSSPTVVNGMVYFGSYDSKIYALNALTGTKNWEYSTGGIILGSPVVANNILYVGSGDYIFYAIDATTGTKKWSYTAAGLLYSSPCVLTNNTVINHSGISGAQQ
jgi:outer membrane protein assembly factor BamB